MILVHTISFMFKLGWKHRVEESSACMVIKTQVNKVGHSSTSSDYLN